MIPRWKSAQQRQRFIRYAFDGGCRRHFLPFRNSSTHSECELEGERERPNANISCPTEAVGVIKITKNSSISQRQSSKTLKSEFF